MRRARLSLEGLSVGDALGEQFFAARHVSVLLPLRRPPPGPWPYTDDTAMALGVVEVLERLGRIDSDALARVFAARYRRDPMRGYGGMAHRILAEIGEGARWRDAAARAFGGQGSMGNGAAMRVAPLGAYFAEDLGEAAAQAERSAVVTHAHPEGRAGAVAVAIAAAGACRRGQGESAVDLLRLALEWTPEGETRAALRRAQSLPLEAPIREAVARLGNGSLVIAPDTVPFALWCAARHLDSYADAIWATISGRGDVDTTSAIAGGIVALATGLDGIPAEWRQCREPIEED
jgi:ADP-ribosylglycohydrolase